MKSSRWKLGAQFVRQQQFCWHFPCWHFLWMITRLLVCKLCSLKPIGFYWYNCHHEYLYEIPIGSRYKTSKVGSRNNINNNKNKKSKNFYEFYLFIQITIYQVSQVKYRSRVQDILQIGRPETWVMKPSPKTKRHRWYSREKRKCPSPAMWQSWTLRKENENRTNLIQINPVELLWYRLFV